MKLVIEVDDCQNYGLAPSFVYKKLCEEHSSVLEKKYSGRLWGMEFNCDRAARELYARIKNRPQNVKNLVLTYSDAEYCSELYKQFAEVWARNACAEL